MRIAICDDTDQDLKNLENLILLYSKLNNIGGDTNDAAATSGAPPLRCCT